MLAPDDIASTSTPSRKITEARYMRYLYDWINEFRKINITLQYYLHIDPYALPLDEWARKVKELEWVRQEEAKSNEK